MQVSPPYGEIMEDNNQNQESAEVEEKLSLDQVNQIVNKAISARFKSFESKFEEFANKVAPKEQPKEEKLSEVASLRKQLENLVKERDEEKSKRKDVNLRNTVKEQLLQTGISQTMIKPAMAMLIDSDKLVAYDDEENLVFKSEEGYQSLQEGIGSWIKNEGKIFQPAKNVTGSGDNRSYKSNSNKTGVPSTEEVAALLEQSLFNL